MCAAIGRQERITQQAIRDLRAILGTGDTINVVATPNGKGQPWIYELAACSTPAKWWEANRVRRSPRRASRRFDRSSHRCSPVSMGARSMGRGQRLFKAAVDNILATLDAIT